MKHLRTALSGLFVCSLATLSSHAGVLVPIPPVVTNTSPETLNTVILSPPSPELAPGFAVWSGNFIEWGQTDAATLAFSVLDSPLPTNYGSFISLQNGTPDTWTGFEIEVSGPGTFDPLSPTAFAGLAAIPQITPSKITFEDLDWGPAPEFSGPTSLNFTLTVGTPLGIEPVLLTFRPIPVPEPTSGLLLAIGGLLTIQRRRR